MKKLFLIACSVLAFNAINAQTNNITPSKTEYMKNNEERLNAKVDRDTDMLEKQLSLTAEQKQKAHDVIAAKVKKQIEVRGKYGHTDDQTMIEKRKNELNAVNEEYKTNIKAILTPEQIKTFETVK